MCFLPMPTLKKLKYKFNLLKKDGISDIICKHQAPLEMTDWTASMGAIKWFDTMFLLSQIANQSFRKKHSTSKRKTIQVNGNKHPEN